MCSLCGTFNKVPEVANGKEKMLANGGWEKEA
jgi:hypothetical protein